MLKIFHAKFQHYASQELSFGKGRKLAFGKGREARDQIANIHWIIEKARELQKKHLPLFH